MNENQAVWNRQPEENNKHYQAFFDYCGLGAGRSLQKLHEHYGRQADGAVTVNPPTKSLRTLERWSSQFAWVERAAAYDAHMIALEQAARERDVKEWVEREIADAHTQLERWTEAWESTPYHEQDWVQETDDPQRPGQKMRVVVVRSNVAKMRNLTRWRKDISDQGRRAYNLPDKITESKTEHSGTVESPGSNWQAFLDDLRRQNQALTDAAEAEGNDPPDWE